MARRLQLDFAPRPSVFQRLGWLLLIAGLACAAMLAYRYVQQGEELARADAQLGTLRQGAAAIQAALSPNSKDSKRAKGELKLAREILARLGLPWDELFSEIETHIDEQVTLLSVEPNAEKSALLVTGEAKDLQAMLAYSKRMHASARFKDVYIQSHQIQVQNPQRPVRFVLSARWLQRPAVAADALTFYATMSYFDYA
jgi:Tfp pilus assembly protein PilN